MICTRRVFRCFKWLERMGDKITGAAGPVFVALAVVLIFTGTICFFDVVQPSLPWPFLSFPTCALIALNMWTHYYLVCTISPGFVDEPPSERGVAWMWAKKRRTAKSGALTGVRWTDDVRITPASVTKCKRCGQMRPERSHHCRICNRCVLKYDHHWVNQCVGLHNERHFILFMAYLVLACFFYNLLGWPAFLEAVGFMYQDIWPYHVPSMAFILTYILSAVICLAVLIMLSWHLWGIARAETSVEAQDHDHYRKMAKARGETFVNSYDLGKRRNLQIFFNIGPDGYPLYTLFFPFRIEPYTDGRSWARPKGYERHHGVHAGDELTDDEIEEEEE